MWKRTPTILGASGLVSLSFFIAFSAILRPPAILSDYSTPQTSESERIASTEKTRGLISDEDYEKFFLEAHADFWSSQMPPKPPPSSLTNTKLTVVDDVPNQLRFLFPAQMPTTATKSGHCLLDVLIDETGWVSNIENVRCTEQIFVSPSLEATIKNRYPIRVKDGQAISWKDYDYKIIYRLLDKDGNIIPE